MRFAAPRSAKSWIEVPVESHFPIQNLPFGLMKAGKSPEPCSIVGDTVIALGPLAERGLAPLPNAEGSNLESVREALFELFENSNSQLRDDVALRQSALHEVGGVELLRPVERIPQFVDFYSGIHHASNVGRMFRPDQPPLLPNYRHMPVAYNGRASSVFASGTPIRRPKGQTKGAQDDSPSFGPTRELDFELEFGFFLSKPTQPGETIAVENADDFIRGFVLVNDWSARDVQRWEYVPLGPFLAKSFATSVSPWIVTPGALADFRILGAKQEPPVLPHLECARPSHLDVTLEATLRSSKMREPQTISRTNTSNLYWSFAQQLVHQASNGTPLEAGDLYASGTISGEDEDSFGSMLELTWRGKRPLALAETGETRKFLEDGDTLTIAGYCQGDGYRIGFGSVVGTISQTR